jgi:hypothetical protein
MHGARVGEPRDRATGRQREPVRPTDEKSSGETARPDARRWRGKVDTTWPQVVVPRDKVEVDPVRPGDE